MSVLGSSERRRILPLVPTAVPPVAAKRPSVLPPRAIPVTVAESFDATEADDVVVNGVPVWRSEWKATGERVRLSHNGEPVTAPVYEASADGSRAQFAAVEVSNGVYLFALPRVAAEPAAVGRRRA